MDGLGGGRGLNASRTSCSRSRCVHSGSSSHTRRLSLTSHQTFLGTNHTGYGCNHGETEQQLVAWQTKLASRQRRNKEALRIVLKFKRHEHARNKMQIAETLQRLTSSALPGELLKLVVEAAAKSLTSSISTIQSSLLETVAEKVFARWPEDLTDGTRSLLRQEAVDVMLKHNFIKVPAKFTSLHTYWLPQILRGKEHMLRYLLLDVYTLPCTSSFTNRLEFGVDSVKLDLPHLEVCVVLLHFHRTTDLDITDVFQTVCDLPTSQVMYRNRCNGCLELNTLEELVVAFIDSFFTLGPGKRKFIRFSHSFGRRKTKWLGALTQVGPQKLPGGVPPTQQPEKEEGWFTTDAQRIFEEAFWGTQGSLSDWKASFHEQQV